MACMKAKMPIRIGKATQRLLVIREDGDVRNWARLLIRKLGRVMVNMPFQAKVFNVLQYTQIVPMSVHEYDRAGIERPRSFNSTVCCRPRSDGEEEPAPFGSRAIQQHSSAAHELHEYLCVG